MIIQQATKLSESTDPYIKEIYEYISKNAKVGSIAGDSTPVVQLGSRQIEEVSQISYEHVKANYVSHFGDIDTLSEARDKTQIKILGDNLVNPVNKVGTMIDPSVYTRSQVPVMMGPYEGSSVYGAGGLPTSIIDKKSRAMSIHGASFKAAENDRVWTTDKLEQLENSAQDTGFNDTISDAAADSFIYGGSIIYPVFKTDYNSSYKKDLNRMYLEKECICRWVETDRWNTVVVPSFIVTARDYLRPKTLYIPQSAIDVSTTRAAMVKPRPVPYWISLYNIGWAPSDIAGWIRSYFGYEITCQSIPVMAQQMSLILYRMPLDALNATLGTEKVKQLMEINEEKMAEWSALSPKAVNMVGEVEVVDRTYSGFEQFIGAMKSDLASQCGIPEPSLWHTPNKGFSDNTTESLLKQSETLQMSQKFLERCMKPCTDALIAHTFGTDSEEWKSRDKVKMIFNKPIISTEKDLAEVGARFAASISSFTQAGVAPDTALKLSSQFFPTVKITEEMLTDAKKSYEEVMKNQEKIGGGVGNTMSTSSGKTTGSFTKAK